MGTKTTEQGRRELLKEAIVIFFEAESTDEIPWVTGNYDRHGGYLIARWFGMSKNEAHNYVYNENKQ